MADKLFRITTALFIFANFRFGDVTPEMIVQSNGNLTLQPNVQGTLEDILWKWNHHKVVEFDQKEVVDYGQFKGRTILDLTTGALTLTNLTEADSGEYVGQLQIKGNLVYHHQMVKVFDAVGKPAVTCQVNGSSVTLLCSGGDRPSAQYRWEGPAMEPQPGSQLKIEAAETSDAVYTCVLHNPVGESRTDFPVKSCFPAPGSASVLISVVLVLLLIFIIVGLLLFYYKKCYKKRQNEEDMEAQSGEKTRLREKVSEAAVNERQQLLPADPENVEETPVKVWDKVKLYKDMTSPGKTHDEDQKTALTEQHKGTDGSAGISQEESQTESLNQGEDSEERGVETEGGNSKHPSSGTVPFSAPESPPAAPPKTENEKEKTNPPEPSPSLPHPPNSPPHPAPAPVQNQDQEAETERAAEAESTDETGANQTAGAQWQREEGGGQDGGSDGGGAQPSGAGGGGAENPTADPAQELPSSPEDNLETQTKSLNQDEDSEERGAETEGGDSKHPSSGTAAPPKTGNEEETRPTPPSSPSPPHPPNPPPQSAPALVQSKDQEAETKTAAAAESTDETAANQRAEAQSQDQEEGTESEEETYHLALSVMEPELSSVGQVGQEGGS